MKKPNKQLDLIQMNHKIMMNPMQKQGFYINILTDDQ